MTQIIFKILHSKKNFKITSFHTLPYRSKFFKIAVPELEEEKCLEMMKKACIQMEEWYNNADKKFTEHNLQDLP